MTTGFRVGQRWISDSEPELGLGSVRRVDRLTVTISFGGSGETREYAPDNAPLRRVRFHPGDTVKSRTGRTLAVAAVVEAEGLLTYRGKGESMAETDLSDTITFSGPEERLRVGQIDSPEAFALRSQALRQQHRRRLSPVRGFVGGRIDLIPHQLFIAAETTSRLVPRVLLADEVGLGKTIEACLILHRLILTGRARRVLILVPDSLVHQWLVEMLRRFNLWFRVFNEKRCEAIETARPGANPFLEDQLILASLRLFTRSEKRVEQAAAADFDVLVVDEAHHLEWSPEASSRGYGAVESLSAAIPGVLLLTATPEQLGMASHFARLRLLDPARFHDLDAFLRESESYRATAEQAKDLKDPQALDDLLDRHGTGRVMFRNSRATIAGFPEREVDFVALDAGPAPDSCRARLALEFESDTRAGGDAASALDFHDDPRITWLLALLRALGEKKILLICQTRQKAEAIEAALRAETNTRIGVFHEGLTLIQRDRQAAFFAEEDGARLLICSEIGSEGRNFQFAHHLVMFDLPLEPELLEQRIGRLDRIGQAETIHLHVPFIARSAQEVLARWYDEGLDAFRKNLQGGRELRERFGPRIESLAREFHQGERGDADEALRQLVAETTAARVELSARLEQGRDRLLELGSFRSERAETLVAQIRERDEDTSLDDFLMATFDQYMIPVEPIAERTFRLGSSGVLLDTFPGLPESGLTITCDRRRALSREDIQFVTWDHPLVTGGLDLILGSEKGNCSFGWWPDTKSQGLYLESIYLLECVAPPPLHVDRFFPPTPIRVLVDHRGEDVSAIVSAEMLARTVQRGDASLLQESTIREELLPLLLRASGRAAESRVSPLIEEARRSMAEHLGREIQRLRDLSLVNPGVRLEEIEGLVLQKSELDFHIAAARLRLDAVRLIRRGSR